MAERADEDRPGFGFQAGAPQDVQDYFAAKTLRPSFHWDEVLPEEHVTAFLVAKATEEGVLLAIRDGLTRALEEGQTLEAFVRELRPKLQELGWWGDQEMTDPVTGEVLEATLGSPRRLGTIFRANVRTAYAAAQWRRIERTRRGLPFLEYRLGPSENHRPHHALKAGLVLPVEHPFWDAWMPPNGWGCKCWVRQITRRAAEDLGVSDAPEVEMMTITDSQGRRREIPEGIDPGWETNPGLVREQALRDHLEGQKRARSGGRGAADAPA